MGQKECLTIVVVLVGILPLFIEGLRRHKEKNIFELNIHFFLGGFYFICAALVAWIITDMGISYGEAANSGPIAHWLQGLTLISIVLPSALASAHLKSWGDGK